MAGKIILIEGPDSTGKTSLYNAIYELSKSDYLHASRYEIGNDKAYEALYHNTLDAALLLRKAGHTIVLDRHLISNIIYDAVFENVFRDNGAFVEQMLGSIDAVVVSLPKDKTVYLDKFAEMKASRAELYGEMSNIYDAYHTLWTGAVDQQNPTVCMQHSWYKAVLGQYLNLSSYMLAKFPNCKCIRYDMQSTSLADLPGLAKEILA